MNKTELIKELETARFKIEEQLDIIIDLMQNNLDPIFLSRSNRYWVHTIRKALREKTENLENLFITFDDMLEDLKMINRYEKYEEIVSLKKDMNLNEALASTETILICNALKESKFVQVEAAKKLGISKSLLQYKINKYSIHLNE